MDLKTAKRNYKKLVSQAYVYLDGGSRGAGEGTSNYVIFPGNEGMLSILERNGQPLNKLSGILK